MDSTLQSKAARIRLVVLDVDGVLTDGSIWTGPDGEAVKRFYTRDGLGIKLLQSAGIPVAILTGRLSRQKDRQGKTFKGAAFKELTQSFGLGDEEVAYMGDDIPDIPPLKAAALAACPADAASEVLPLADFVSSAPGGNGAVRSLAELILRAQNRWDDLVNRYYVQGESLYSLPPQPTTQSNRTLTTDRPDPIRTRRTLLRATVSSRFLTATGPANIACFRSTPNTIRTVTV